MESVSLSPAASMRLKSKLSVSTGLSSAPGPNEANEDCLGACLPGEPELSTKGVALAIADGVSAAEAGKQAAEICVQGFLNDYYDAPEGWTARVAGLKVMTALNRWLYGLGQSHTSDGAGYLTTFTAVVLKGATAYSFHVGDSRLWRCRKGVLEQLTRDHSVRYGRDKYGLARSMGMDVKVDIDVEAIPVEVGDLILLTTDGVHGFLDAAMIRQELNKACEDDLNEVCACLVAKALDFGGDDNASALLAKVESTGMESSDEMYRRYRELPFPPDLYPGMSIDGYEVERELQATSRSQAYVVREKSTGRQLVMKTPSRNFEDDAGYIERFMMEGWVGTRLKSDHLLATVKPAGGQNFLYTLMDYIEGEDIESWMKRNPKPDVRSVVEIGIQVLRGLRAMHRHGMLHQDLKPSNVILHPERGAVIIDYGSTFVPGIQEIPVPFERERALGTLGYSAPEYFLNKEPSRKSDLFSLAVLLYEMLTGKLPYGERYERCHSLRAFSALEYLPASQYNNLVPVWLDGALKKALRISPQSRYESYSEFEYDLQHPNPKFAQGNALPWIERNPNLTWKIICGVLVIAEGATLYFWLRGS